jgi:hypothetical protein
VEVLKIVMVSARVMPGVGSILRSEETRKIDIQYRKRDREIRYPKLARKIVDRFSGYRFR